MALLPMKLEDFVKIAEENDRRVWYFEKVNAFELYTVAESVISYAELPKEGLNMEKTFSSKPFIGSKSLPASLMVVNNYNIGYLQSQMIEPKMDSVPKHEEEEREEVDHVTGAVPDYHKFF